MPKPFKQIVDGPLSREALEVKSRSLQEAEIFHDLAPSDMAEIKRITTVTACPKGRVLYAPNGSAEVLFILEKGRRTPGQLPR